MTYKLDQQKTKIISGFAGVGKSYYCKKYPNETLDLDSSSFSWLKNGKRNTEFPDNYIEHIKNNINLYKYIFISSHEEVRNKLINNCIFFFVFFPHENRKEEFIKKYKNRKDNESFIKLIKSNWNKWIKDIRAINYGCKKICMLSGNLEDNLKYINYNEHYNGV